MKSTLSMAQVMSLHSGFSYCPGPEIGAAVEKMIGNDGFIAALSFQPIMAIALEQQYPWLKDVPKQPEDWQSILLDFERLHGALFEVKDNAEQLNGIA